ncbi:MAG TPA: ankyrin repeat domain-containing protein [Gammaproteobacteria bacterium]
MKNPLLLLLVLVPVICIAQSDQELALDFMAMKEAARKGDMTEVKALLDKGINPNGYSFKETPTEEIYFSQLTNRPIHEASEQGHFQLVRLLLEYGADPNWCCCSCVTALHIAIKGGHVEIARLLLENGADPTILYDQEIDSFGLAERKGNKEMIKIVNEYKAEVRASQ